MRYRILVLTLVAVLALGACNLSSEDSEPLSTLTPVTTIEPGGKPTVTIISPQNGAEYVVNDPVLISVNAMDTVGVTRVQLLANGQIVRTVSSESAAGETNKNVLLDYTPRSAGSVILQVMAYRGTVASDPAEITVLVRASQVLVTATAQFDLDIPTIDPFDQTCRAQINANLNFRAGPGTSFGIIRVLGYGEVIPIVGRLGDNTWWQLRSGATYGWVHADYIIRYGNCSSIPVTASPATPTSSVPTSIPTATTIPVFPTSTPIPTSTPEPLPNLMVTNVVGATRVTIPSGQTSVTETYSMNITNLGGTINRQFSNSVRILNGALFDAGAVGNLGAGQTISLRVDVTFTATGDFILQFMADKDSEIQESNEGDNSFIFNVTVVSG